MRTPRTRNEHGAVAVVVAICAVLIFSMCAMAVDLGNAFARKRDIQTQADLAALAAAAELPHTATSESAILTEAATFAAANKTVGQATSTWNFTDASPSNGYVEFFAGNPNKLRLITPPARVDFGLAGIMGFSGTDVAASATVEIRTPGQAAPFYVAESCATGQQTLVDTSNGHNNPTLVPSSQQDNNATLTSISPNQTPVNTAPPSNITITGSGLTDVTQVGFTTDGGAFPHVSVPASAFTTHTGTTITFALPPDVYNHQFYWFVRLAKGVASDVKWTKTANALGFTVGSPYFICDGSQSGNFGLLKLSREDSNSSDWDNRNIVLGIQRSLTLWPYPSNIPVDCGGQPDAVEDPYKQQAFSDLINCLSTYPGLPSNGATEGLIGKGGVKGRLARSETHSGCAPDGTDAELHLEKFDGNNSYDINNDVLSCFFLNTSVSVEDVTHLTGAPAHVISDEVFDSPRFFWVPVLKDDPSHGRSGRYAITRFQPLFLTGQPLSATKTSPGGNMNNGMTFDSSGLGEIKAVMINPESLPDSSLPSKSGTIPYVGVGTKVYTLVE